MPFSKTVFVNMMTKATGGMFLYKDKLYQQVDGVAMGSPLGPTLANFFLGHVEKTLFENLDCAAPAFYARYVDDVFCIFHSEADIEEFFQHLNRQHSNLKFTVERGTDKLAFLDVEVKLSESGVETSVYRKSTHTGVFMNFAAVVPSFWKRGALYGMFHRAQYISSTIETFNQEVAKIRTLFSNNGYPHAFINKVLQKFNELKDLSPVQRAELRAGSDEPGFSLRIPFLGKASIDFRKEITQILMNKFKVNVRPVFSSCKVGDFFQLKSSVPDFLSANVVYRFKCLCDTNLTYIGETERHLIDRVKEHLDLRSEKRSAIKDHILTCQICQEANISNFEILKKCRDPCDVKMQEAFLIRRFKPSLNVQLYQSGAMVVLKIF